MNTAVARTSNCEGARQVDVAVVVGVRAQPAGLVGDAARGDRNFRTPAPTMAPRTARSGSRPPRRPAACARQHHREGDGRVHVRA